MSVDDLLPLVVRERAVGGSPLWLDTLRVEVAGTARQLAVRARGGLFTGATFTRNGAVAGAAGGTLLLDEVGELPVEPQPALLRLVD